MLQGRRSSGCCRQSPLPLVQTQWGVARLLSCTRPALTALAADSAQLRDAEVEPYSQRPRGAGRDRCSKGTMVVHDLTRPEPYARRPLRRILELSFLGTERAHTTITGDLVSTRSSKVSGGRARPVPTLSGREREVLELVAAGQTKPQIAAALSIGPRAPSTTCPTSSPSSVGS